MKAKKPNGNTMPVEYVDCIYPASIDFETKFKEYPPPQGLNREAIKYFIHYIMSVKHDKPEAVAPGGYVRLDSRHLKALYHRSGELLQWLENARIIEINHSYWSDKGKGFCKAYRLAEPYWMDKTIRHDQIYSRSLINAIRKDQFQVSDFDHARHRISPVCPIIDKNLKHIGIVSKDDIRLLEEYIHEEYNYLQDYPKSRIVNRDGIYYNQKVNPIDIYRSRMRHLSDLKDRFYMPSFQSRSNGRHNNILTMMPSVFRNILTLDGSPLVEMDWKNAHPLLLTGLIKNKIWDHLKYLRIGTPFDYILNKIQNHLPILIEMGERINETRNFQKYHISVAYGEYYDDLAKLNNVSRDKAKKDNLSLFYCEPNDDRFTERLNRMNEAFPTIVWYVTEIKKILGNSDFACFMHRIESYICVERTGKLLDSQGIWFEPVHDSYILRESDLPKAYEIVHDEMINTIEISGCLGEEWQEDNDQLDFGKLKRLHPDHIRNRIQTKNFKK